LPILRRCELRLTLGTNIKILKLFRPKTEKIMRYMTEYCYSCRQKKIKISGFKKNAILKNRKLAKIAENNRKLLSQNWPQIQGKKVNVFLFFITFVVIVFTHEWQVQKTLIMEVIIELIRILVHWSERGFAPTRDLTATFTLTDEEGWGGVFCSTRFRSKHSCAWMCLVTELSSRYHYYSV
jgi:hypothetical protein